MGLQICSKFEGILVTGQIDEFQLQAYTQIDGTDLALQPAICFAEDMSSISVGSCRYSSKYFHRREIDVVRSYGDRAAADGLWP
jgi:hypothetical protein